MYYEGTRNIDEERKKGKKMTKKIEIIMKKRRKKGKIKY